MLKQTHLNHKDDRQNQLHLYDKVRQDLFEEKKNKKRKQRAPSITTIILLQIQAYTIQLLVNLPPINCSRNALAPSSSSQPTFSLVYQQKRLHIITSIKSIVRQCLRWGLLVFLLILDNIARVLNVEREMNELTNQAAMVGEKKTTATTRVVDYEQDDDEEEETDEQYMIQSSTTDTFRSSDDYHCLQKKSSFYRKGNSIINEHSNNDKEGCLQPRSTHGYSPINSPTPNFIRPRPSSAVIQQQPSRVNNRARSLSNNMIDNKQQQQKLRRITGQREITVQNATLPIPSRAKKPTASHIKTGSVASRSSDESMRHLATSYKPKMQKTQSLSTAQQYHHHHHNNEVY